MYVVAKSLSSCSTVDNFNLKCTLHDNSVANSISNDIVIGGTFQM